MTLSIVASFHNEQEGISKFFEQLMLLIKNNSNIDAVLIDNASIDQTYEELLNQGKFQKSIKVIQNPSGLGYGDGIRIAIKESTHNHVLIFPGDLQYSGIDAQKLINIYSNFSHNERKHLNIFTNRNSRLDGKYNKARGYVWKKFIQILFDLPSNSDPASQLRILCKCCIIESNTSDFFWDLEVFIHCFQKKFIIGTVEVLFFPRAFGKSSNSSKLFRTELKALQNLIKMRIKSSKNNTFT